MLRKFFATTNDWSLLVLRLGLGLVILPHGLQKTLGLFGGYGFAGTYGFFTDQMGLPGVAAVLVILAESFGALGLIFGALTRLGAFGIAAVMAGAITMVHWQNGFFMNWSGKAAGEGFEFHLLAITIAIVLLIRGGGAASIDRLLARR
jgi:putative oxidoreductase